MALHTARSMQRPFAALHRDADAQRDGSLVPWRAACDARHKVSRSPRTVPINVKSPTQSWWSATCAYAKRRGNPRCLVGGRGSSSPSHPPSVQANALVDRLCICSRLGAALLNARPKPPMVRETPSQWVVSAARINPPAGAPPSNRRRATGERRSGGGQGWRSCASGIAQRGPRSMHPPRRSPGPGSRR